MSKIKNIAKQIIPPILLPRIKQKRVPDDNEFTGSYSSWLEASKNSNGYDQQSILKKIKEASLKVKNGEAAYERDSVLFDKVEYSWELLAGLLRIALMNNNRLKVLDFGGSLGTSYFQNRAFLSSLDKLEWNVVEQPLFADCGKEFFEDDILKFYYSLEEFLVRNSKIDVVIFSGILQYLEDPLLIIKKLIKSGIPNIIIDKTTFIENENDRIFIQHVPEFIYKASYPIRFFNEQKFIAEFTQSFNLLAEFNCYEKYRLTFNGLKAAYKGFIFERKTQS